MPQSFQGAKMVKQLNLNIYKGKQGGRRPGAGRKRQLSKGVAHRQREKVKLSTPLHINFKVKLWVRNKAGLRLLKHAIRNAQSHGLGVLHFSLQSNHVHLIVEAKSNEVLTKAMRSLCITFSKGLGKGRIQLERYHLHVLKTLQETKHAVHYVLFNRQKHMGLKKAYMDEFSSLGAVQELNLLAKSAKMTVIWNRILQLPRLNAPAGWMMKQVLNHQI
jgi:REP element-mobilizing transposase RayT